MKFTDFPDTERTPLLQNIVTESRQYAANADHMGTFFTPVDSSDDEDVSRKHEGSRRLSRSNELFMSIAKLTPDKVWNLITFAPIPTHFKTDKCNRIPNRNS